MSVEIWRPVKGFDNSYQVSNLGRVKSVDKFVKHKCGGFALRKGKIRVLGIYPKTGYVGVSLWEKQNAKQFLVHRLVAEAFPDICGETFDGYEVDHINTVRTDNRAENLRVCTRRENHMNPITRQNYSKAHKGKKTNMIPWNKGLKLPDRMGAGHPLSKKIYMCDENLNILAEFDCISEAARALNIRHTAICNNLTGRSRKCNGYIFKYKGVSNCP